MNKLLLALPIITMSAFAPLPAEAHGGHHRHNHGQHHRHLRDHCHGGGGHHHGQYHAFKHCHWHRHGGHRHRPHRHDHDVLVVPFGIELNF